MEQLTTKAISFSVREPSASPSLVKRNQDHNLSTPIERVSSKRTRLMEDIDLEDLTPFFCLFGIHPSRVPSTPKEFAVVVANEDLAFVRSLSVTNRRDLFADAYRTLFNFGSLISMGDVGHDNVQGSGDLSRERDELEEKYESLERENVKAEKELVKLQVKPKISDSLHKEVDRYDS